MNLISRFMLNVRAKSCYDVRKYNFDDVGKSGHIKVQLIRLSAIKFGVGVVKLHDKYKTLACVNNISRNYFNGVLLFDDDDIPLKENIIDITMYYRLSQNKPLLIILDNFSREQIEYCASFSNNTHEIVFLALTNQKLINNTWDF